MPGHYNIYDNEQADKLAKNAANADFCSSNIIDCSSELGISVTYLKSSIKQSLLQSWYNYYNSAKKGASYQNLNIQSV